MLVPCKLSYNADSWKDGLDGFVLMILILEGCRKANLFPHALIENNPICGLMSCNGRVRRKCGVLAKPFVLEVVQHWRGVVATSRYHLEKIHTEPRPIMANITVLSRGLAKGIWWTLSSWYPPQWKLWRNPRSDLQAEANDTFIDHKNYPPGGGTFDLVENQPWQVLTVDSPATNGLTGTPVATRDLTGQLSSKHPTHVPDAVSSKNFKGLWLCILVFWVIFLISLAMILLTAKIDHGWSW